MAALPAFERRADRVQYAMLENKKRGFRDHKETVRLPHVTLLENWKRKLVARNEDDEDFLELMEETAKGFREKDEKAHKLATEPTKAFDDALKAIRAQVGQPDPLAGRTEEERRQFVQIRNFHEKTISPLEYVSQETLNNWIEKEKKKRLEGEGRVTRSGRRLVEVHNVPAVAPEEQDVVAVAPAIVDIPIGVPLNPEMLQAVEAILFKVAIIVDEVEYVEQEQVESSNRCRSHRFHAVEPVNDEEPLARQARLAEELVEQPTASRRRSQRVTIAELAVEVQEQELHGETLATFADTPAADEPSTSDAGVLTLRLQDRKPASTPTRSRGRVRRFPQDFSMDDAGLEPEQPDLWIQKVEEPIFGRRRSQRLVSVDVAAGRLEQGQPTSPSRAPMAANDQSSSDFEAFTPRTPTRRLRESFLALALATPKPEQPASPKAVDDVPEEQEEVLDDEMEVDEEEEAEDAAPEEAPKRSMRQNPTQTARFMDYIASKNPVKQQPENVQPVQATQPPGPNQPAQERSTRKKVMPQKLNGFVLF